MINMKEMVTVLKSVGIHDQDLAKLESCARSLEKFINFLAEKLDISVEAVNTLIEMYVNKHATEVMDEMWDSKKFNFDTPEAEATPVIVGEIYSRLCDEHEYKDKDEILRAVVELGKLKALLGK